jgi:flagellar biosynthesis protein FlhA
LRAPHSFATYLFAGVVLAIVGILIVPLPPPLLDCLLAVDLLFAGLVLLMSIVINEPLELAAFAPGLLIATLFRLALDVSATRLILSRGHEANGVGALIPAFGAFVVQGNAIVGIVIFIILITIQFVVIAAGAGRVAEVAARFTLDAMPGKQMAIDAELHAGAIDAAAAKRRRALVQREADFFGAMDGAGKFVKGDAVAALVIVALNLVGGVAVGVFSHGMDVAGAFSTYALLSIGNAILTSLPSFLLSTAMGLLVTRVAADGSLGADLATQLFHRPDVLRMCAGFAFVLGSVPVLPHLLFFGLGALLLVSAEAAGRRRRQAGEREALARERARRAAIRRPETALGRLGVDVIAIDFGHDLLPLCRGAICDALLDRIGEVRRVLVSELGIVLPGVRLRDDPAGDGSGYTILFRDEVVARGRLHLDRFLAIADPAVHAKLPGSETRDPVYGLPARAILPEERAAAARLGALVFDPISILGSHLAEAARAHAARLVGRQELQTMVEHLHSTVPSLMKEIGGDRVPLPLVLRVFQALLRERVWPRDAVTTFEALLDAASETNDEGLLLERVRAVLVPLQLSRRGLRVLQPFMLDPEFEVRLTESLTGRVSADPRILAPIRDALAAYAQLRLGPQAAVLCSSPLRRYLADLLLRFKLDVPVYAFNELPQEIEIRMQRLYASAVER